MGLWICCGHTGVAQISGATDRFEHCMVAAFTWCCRARTERAVAEVRRQAGAFGKTLCARLWRGSGIERVSRQGLQTDHCVEHLAGVAAPVQIQTDEFLAELLAHSF